MGLRSVARTGGDADAGRRLPFGNRRRVLWGWFDAAPTDRTRTCIRYRLRILPPGTTPAQCRLLVLLRRLPLFALCAATLAIALAAPAGSAAGALMAIVVAAAVVMVGVLAATRDTRRRAVTIEATRCFLGGEDEIYGDLPFIVHCMAALTAADRALAAGEIDRVRHEAAWWRIYDEASEAAQSLKE